jgi:glucosyl-3-phosphoglycerate synthase
MSIHEPRPSVTLCIPARNEAATIGRVVEYVRGFRDGRLRAVDEILVVDDRSDDGTGDIARAAGARVVRTDDHCPGGSRGKGDAVWTSLQACDTDLIGWMDGDLVEFPDRLVPDLFAPLVDDDSVQLVKGAFTRINADGTTVVGGRVTSLTAKPLLALLNPELAALADPLSGVFAGRTEVLRTFDIEPDYGVDIGIVLDVSSRFGPWAIREVHLGHIVHRQQEIDRLSAMATMVARTIIDRNGGTDRHDDHHFSLR